MGELKTSTVTSAPPSWRPWRMMSSAAPQLLAWGQLKPMTTLPGPTQSARGDLCQMNFWAISAIQSLELKLGPDIPDPAVTRNKRTLLWWGGGTAATLLMLSHSDLRSKGIIAAPTDFVSRAGGPLSHQTKKQCMGLRGSQHYLQLDSILLSVIPPSVASPGWLGEVAPGRRRH